MGLGEPHSKQSKPPDVASDLAVLDGLLSALTDVLDIREVFDRVSKSVQPVLPHDGMGVVEINETADRCRIEAGAGLPTATPTFEIPAPDPEMLKQWDALVLDDVQTHIFFRKGPAIRCRNEVGREYRHPPWQTIAGRREFLLPRVRALLKR